MGYWIDKGTADQQALTFMSSIDNTKIFSFFTLGAAPIPITPKHAATTTKPCTAKTVKSSGPIAVKVRLTRS